MSLDRLTSPFLLDVRYGREYYWVVHRFCLTRVLFRTLLL
ncbi:hypothetical protein [Escherichia phage vB_EcoM_LMP25]|uniref:Uncharacterized protein n=1 Tax=Escherichia phage vB_EcoM_LMP25 TaxID=2491663 RepID=A0A482MRQ1_9CAUD|nr:hypothetical protein [Escherichia phage vB_EcoM_LMP34]QBQ76192.1 hypothetical protein [Escherichia phage vB_EcoM_LMP33]QBQ76328.1 hypothetical protein [Escherichia phage vB_EcoM_LMP25]